MARLDQTENLRTAQPAAIFGIMVRTSPKHNRQQDFYVAYQCIIGIKALHLDIHLEGRTAKT